MTPARVELGRRLFYDARLSGNGTQSCATCHVQSLAFTDGRARGLGSTGEEHPRSPMSLVNVAYRDTLTWAHPSLRSLEEQALVPMLGTSPVELGLQGHERRDLSASSPPIPVYRPLFAAAFPGVDASGDDRQRGGLPWRRSSDRSCRSDPRSIRYRELRGSRRRCQRRRCADRCCSFRIARRAASVVIEGSNLDGGAKTVATPADEVPVFTFHNTGLYNLAGTVVVSVGQPRPVRAHRARSRTSESFASHVAQHRPDAAVHARRQHQDPGRGDAPLQSKGGRARNVARTDQFVKPFEIKRAREGPDIIAFLESLTDPELLRDPRWSNPWK